MCHPFSTRFSLVICLGYWIYVTILSDYPLVNQQLLNMAFLSMFLPLKNCDFLGTVRKSVDSQVGSFPRFLQVNAFGANAFPMESERRWCWGWYGMMMGWFNDDLRWIPEDSHHLGIHSIFSSPRQVDLLKVDRLVSIEVDCHFYKKAASVAGRCWDELGRGRSVFHGNSLGSGFFRMQKMVDLYSLEGSQEEIDILNQLCLTLVLNSASWRPFGEYLAVSSHESQWRPVSLLFLQVYSLRKTTHSWLCRLTLVPWNTYL